MAKLYILLAIGAALQLAVQGAPVLSVCNTPQCALSAANILKDIRPSVDPCVDFSQYSCGGFYEREQIPADSNSINYFSMLENHNADVVRSVVTPTDPKAPVAPQDDPASQRNIKKLQDLYSSCMNEDQLVKIGRQPLEVEIRKIVELYPVYESNLHLVRRQLPDGDRRALSSLLAYNMKNGFSNFFVFDVRSGIEDPSLNIMTLSESGLGLARTDYARAEIVKRYEEIIGEMFYNIQGSVGPSPSTNTTRAVPEVWASIAKEVVDFETALTLIATEAESLSDPLRTTYIHSVSELDQWTPSLDWKLILESAFPPNVSIPTTVMILAPEYFRKLDTLLQQTRPKTIQNYFAWNVMRFLGNYISEPYRKPLQKYNSMLTGSSFVLDRWKVCVATVNAHLGQMAGHYFVKAAIPTDTVPKMTEIVNNVRQAYATDFSGQHQWLDSTTSKNALEKLNAVTQKVGYSTEAPNVAATASVDEYYSGLTVDALDYFGNTIRSSAFVTRQKFERLAGPINKIQMGSIPQIVNADYRPSSNEIRFPAGILQPPFFHAEHPEYLNYGGIGYIAGHELGHGFDNRGRQFDGSGRFRNWWTNSSLAEFTTRSQCFVDQYSNFTVKGPNGKDYAVDGQKTLGENIADNGGLKKSYEMWWTRYQSDPTGQTYNNHRLPGLDNHTPEQLFFIQFARLWCSNERPQFTVSLLEGPHSPKKWRINGVAQNSEHFAKAFQCKPGTPMNPIKKCEVW
ncbi:hypothetical protein BGZ67_005710 [Mortierella alpina]|nr:hypothetical protein BGZ67_005710 [Mortierella alpina]